LHYKYIANHSTNQIHHINQEIMIEESKIKSELKFLKTIQKKAPKAIEHYMECQEDLTNTINLKRAKKMIKETFQTEIDLLLSNPEQYFKNK